MESEIHEEDSDQNVNNTEPPSLSVGQSGQKEKRVDAAMSRTQNKDVSSKKKRPSKTATMQAEIDNRFKSIEDNFSQKFDMLFQMVGNLNASKTGNDKSDVSNQNRDLLRSDCNNNNKENVPVGERRPILSLEPNLDQYLGSPRVSRNQDFDIRSEISLHVNQQENDELCDDIRSDIDSTGDSPVRHSGTHDNIVSDHKSTNASRRSDRFYKHVQMLDSEIQDSNVNDKENDKSSDTCMRSNVLSQIFKEDIVDNSKASVGLIIDQAQVNILENSWRCKNPERLSAYREEYKGCFPIHDSSVNFLQVPSLDDLLEPMLRRTHGPKAVKSWDNHRQLFTQPLKQIEKLSYQGQLAARMNIIAMLYMQQALGTLLNKLENDNEDKEAVCQIVNDLFAMSTKALDQSGRTGAFFHLIRRKAAAQDSGLVNLKDIQSKVQYMPLSEDGVFGQGLESCLEKRKEQKDQLNDLLPELNRKRKFEDNREFWVNKAPKYNSDQNINSRNTGNTSAPNSNSNSRVNYTRKNYNKPQQKDSNNKGTAKEGNKKDQNNKSSAQNTGGWGSFRIPKKNNS